MIEIERIVFFGTPEFAVPTLDALHAAGRTPIRVVSQPSRPSGRGRRISDPPVARWAREHDVPLMQPQKVKARDFQDELAQVEPDLAIVVAFGQIFPKRLLELPRYGCINVHASLLPAYRGASPIVAAIAAGETTTGVSTMVMEQGLDTGPVLLQESTAIGEEETAGELSDRLSRLGADLMIRTLEELEAGRVVPRPQPEEGVSFAPLLDRSVGRVDWRLPARTIHDRVRAFSPWPGSTASIRDEAIRILKVSVEDSTEGTGADDPGDGAGEPGQLLGPRGDGLRVRCGESSVISLERVQRPGRKPATGRDFFNGLRLTPGETFQW